MSPSDRRLVTRARPTDQRNVGVGTTHDGRSAHSLQPDLRHPHVLGPDLLDPDLLDPDLLDPDLP